MEAIHTRFRAMAVALAGACALPLSSFGSQVVTQWYHGQWTCNIDGRPAVMQWYVVNDPQTRCDGNICSTTSGVKTVGRFSDNGGPWARLDISFQRNSQVGIRYLGNEPDNWMLTYSIQTGIAQGWTTWRGQRYPLKCWNRVR